MTKSQISVEFILIITLVLLIFIGFLAIIYSQFSETEEKRDYILMMDLANSIKNEVLLATQVQHNYVRKFEIPYKINSKDYKIDLEKDILTTTNEDKRSVTILLPVEVKGGFIEKTELGQLEHCITKNEFDGIRISRNQASIDPILEDTNGNGIPDVEPGKEFEVNVKLNCLEDITTIGFTIELTNLEYRDEFETPHQKDDVGRIAEKFIHKQPFFEKKPKKEKIIHKLEKTVKTVDKQERLILSFIIPQEESSSGSGNILDLTLTTKKGVDNATIEFVKEKLFLIDASANYLTKEALPSSYVDAVIEVLDKVDRGRRDK